jgi:hypothetical protein
MRSPFSFQSSFYDVELKMHDSRGLDHPGPLQKPLTTIAQGFPAPPFDPAMYPSNDTDISTISFAKASPFEFIV